MLGNIIEWSARNRFLVVLATLFNFAFSNLHADEIMKTIPLAVVDNDHFQKDNSFQQALESAADSEVMEGQPLFRLQYLTEEKAELALNDNQISGYIILNPDIQLIVSGNGLNQTIIRSFLDEYIQTTATISRIIQNNPDAIEKGLLDQVEVRNDYLHNQPISSSSPDTTLNYFYALLGMTCLYGSFWGVKEITDSQANQSVLGARLATIPTHKLFFLVSSLSASIVIQFLQMVLLIIYMHFILGVHFGVRLPLILLLCLIGSLAGIAMGTFIGAAFRGKEGIKTAVQIVSSMVLSFLAGMMYVEMKYIVMKNMPILGYLNPAHLISDAFYSLYTFDHFQRFTVDILCLLGFTLIMGLGSYFFVRRRTYASL